jgi:thiamine biosynthesis lipoprotein
MLCSFAKTPASRSFFALDTAVSISLVGNNSEETANALSEAIMSESEKLAACYELTADEVLSDNADLIQKTEALNSRYGLDVNIFCGELTRIWGISTDSPRVPDESEIKAALLTIPTDKSGIISGETRLDPGAVAKGYVLDRAKTALEMSGEKTDYAVISTESSVLLYGEKTGGEPFLTGIKKRGGGLAGYIKTGAAFISTAGGTERYAAFEGEAAAEYIHIIDLKTGYPVLSDLDSVTVIIPADEPDGGIKSDFLSTAMFITGSEHLDSYGVTYVAVTNEGVVLTNTEVFPYEN